MSNLSPGKAAKLLRQLRACERPDLAVSYRNQIRRGCEANPRISLTILGTTDAELDHLVHHNQLEGLYRSLTDLQTLTEFDPKWPPSRLGRVFRQLLGELGRIPENYGLTDDSLTALIRDKQLLHAERVARAIVTGDFETEDDGKRLEIELSNLLCAVNATLSDLGPYGAVLATVEHGENVESARDQVANLREPDGILKHLACFLLANGLRQGRYTATEVGLSAVEADNLLALDEPELMGRVLEEIDDPGLMPRLLERQTGVTVVRLDADAD
jgi:hypothetical protein